MFRLPDLTQPLPLTALCVSAWMACAHLFWGGALVLDGSPWLALAWLCGILLAVVSASLWCAVRIVHRLVGSLSTAPLVLISAWFGWVAGPGDELSGARVLVAFVAAGIALGTSSLRGDRSTQGAPSFPWLLVAIGLLACIGWRTVPSDWADWSIPEAEAGHNVLLIGVDGLDYELLHRYRDEGKVPTLGRLMEEGTSGPLRTFQPTSSPFIWNSIYTGYTPALHQRRPRGLAGPGRLLLESKGGEPLARALRVLRSNVVATPPDMWSVMRASGYQTATFGTWERAGVDTANRVSLTEMAEYAPLWTADKRLLGSEREWAVWTRPEYRAAMSEADRAPSELPDSLWESILGENAQMKLAMASYAPEASFPAKRMARLRAITASDRMRATVAADALKRCDERCFTFVYLRGIDVLQHVYSHLLRGDPAGEGEEELDLVVERYHTYVDGLIEELVGAAPAGTRVWIVSDHGLDLSQRPDGKREATYNTGFHDFAPDGTWIAVGPGLEREEPVAAHVLDIAPTILSQAGLPTLADMEGRVIREITEPGVTVDNWLDRVPTLYDRGAPSLSSAELDEQLKALGYVDE